MVVGDFSQESELLLLLLLLSDACTKRGGVYLRGCNFLLSTKFEYCSQLHDFGAAWDVSDAMGKNEVVVQERRMDTVRKPAMALLQPTKKQRCIVSC